jgi:hydroxymethylpyrimidine pyrophosphatase-like HAD family hydrolase
VLSRYRTSLEQGGLETNAEGRVASFRTSAAETAFDPIARMPQDIFAVRNGPYLDFVTRDAGKDRAAARLLRQLELELSRAAYIGDDQNDVDLLDQVGMPMTLAGCQPSVLATVRKKNRVCQQSVRT